jgi:hypothetical protein
VHSSQDTIVRKQQDTSSATRAGREVAELSLKNTPPLVNGDSCDFLVVFKPVDGTQLATACLAALNFRSSFGASCSRMKWAVLMDAGHEGSDQE